MNYTIRNECLAVTVSSLGAEMLGVKAFGKERLWQNENGSWSGHAPVLFPVCGSCGVTVNGKTYEVGAHGFARKSEFTLKHISEGKIILSLKSSEETKKKYPFDFVFKAEYALAGNSVNIIYTVENPSDSELPFSCGGHESFALAAEKIYAKLENDGNLKYADDADALGAAIYRLSGVHAAEINGEEINSFFGVNDKRVNKILGGLI